MKLSILALSYLFPNTIQPNYGIFVFNRLKAVQEFCEVKVIAPLQWYPLRNLLQPELATNNAIVDKEYFGNLETRYPRFSVIPRYLKFYDAFSYYAAVKPVVSKMLQDGFTFDVIDTHWTYPDILAAFILSRQYRKPFIVTIRGREALYLGEWGGRKRILDWCLRRADAVVALSSELADLVVDIGVERRKVRVVLNGIATENFNYLDCMDARNRLGLPQNKKIIISVGSLIERKGHHEIIKLLPELNSRFDLDFFVIGDVNPEGNFTKSINRLISELKLKNVHFVSKVTHSELIYWYNSADLFCLATKGEGCPNVVMEALACGTPVVVTNVGAVPDLVMDGANGYIVESLSQLPIRIVDALNREWDREEIALKAQRRTWNACAEEVVGVYRNVLESYNDYDKESV